MNNQAEPILKMRFRLPNGEEFEAEGTREFIERERNYFLALIGQQKAPVSQVSPTISAPAIPHPPVPALSNAPALSTASASTPYHTELYLWERLLKEDGEVLTLRRKAKLTVPELAAILIAGARVLLKKKAYSALELAKSLKACGVAEGRLDRILAPEIQAGRLVAQGAKRSRTYSLTDEGFAKAFVLAEKLSKSDL